MGINSILRCFAALALTAVCLVAASATALAQAPGPVVIDDQDGKLRVNGKPDFLVIQHVAIGCPSRKAVAAGVQHMGVELFRSDFTGCGIAEAPDGTETYLSQLLTGRALWWSKVPTYVNSLPEHVSWQARWRATRAGRNPLIRGDGEFMYNCRSTAQLFENTVRMPSGIPSLYWINLGQNPGKPDLASCLTPRSMAAQVMSFVAAGGDALEYYTGDAGTGKDFTVRPDIIAQAGVLSSALKMLEPALVGGVYTRVATDPGSPVKAGSWLLGGFRYILAVNTGTTTVNGRLPVTGLGNTAQVMRERRTLAIRGNVIADRFGPHSWHLYRVPVARK